MPKKNQPFAKERILKAAVLIFAEKSFDGSRIDQIAQEAGVPKSLIYYHFQSKEEILAELIRSFIQEYTGLTRMGTEETHQAKAAAMPDREKRYRDFAVRNADLIRIILIDSLKKSQDNPVIFEVVEAMVAAEEGSLLQNSSEHYDRNERLVAEFYTNLIPLYAYLCFSEAWIGRFGIGRKELDETFMKVMMATHGAYHKNHDKP